MKTDFDMLLFREGETYVAYCPELDVSSCGSDVDEARANLKTAVRLFIEEIEKLGTLDQVLREAGDAVDAGEEVEAAAVGGLTLVVRRASRDAP